LNLAGLFAPMIAIVPTGVGVECNALFVGGSVAKSVQMVDPIVVQAQTEAGLFNNIIAYFGVTLIALFLLWRYPQKFLRGPERIAWFRRAILVYFAVVVVFGVSAWNLWFGRASFTHNVAAIAMFGAFGVVVAYNGWARSRAPARYAWWCRWIVVAMILAVIAWPAVAGWMLDVRWWAFGLEATELALFTVFWVMQTAVFWERDPISGDRLSVASER
jgi:hypothetical protein